MQAILIRLSLIACPPMVRAATISMIGFTIAVARAYHQSDPRVIHATGCFITRPARMVSSFSSTRLPLPAAQFSSMTLHPSTADNVE